MYILYERPSIYMLGSCSLIDSCHFDPVHVFHVSIVSGYVIEFEIAQYTIGEGSALVSVCLRVESENILEPTQATIEIATVEGTATSKQNVYL